MSILATDMDIVGDMDRRSEVIRDKANMLYAAAPSVLLASFICSIILVTVLWPVIGSGRLLAWAAVNTAVLLLRYMLVIRFRALKGPALTVVLRHTRYFHISVLASAITFGSAGVFLFPYESVAHLVLLAFMIGGMALGSVGGYFFSRQAFYLYSVPVLLPGIITAFIHGGIYGSDIHYSIGVTGLIFTVILGVSSQKINRAFTNSMYLQLDNKDLVKELTHEIEIRVHAERRALENERRFRRLFNDAPLGAAIISMDGTIEETNPKLCEYLGYDDEELVNTELVSILLEEDRMACATNVSKVASGEIGLCDFDSRFVKKDGSAFWGLFSIRLVKDTSGTPLYYILMVENINDRKLMEREVNNAKQLWEATFNSLPDSVCILDMKQNIIMANAATGELSGVDEVVGKNVCELLCEGGDFTAPCPCENKGDATKPALLEFNNTTLDKHLEIRVFPLHDAEWNHVGAVHITRDITERKKAEKALTDSERRYSLLANNISDVIWTRDMDLNLTYISPSIETHRGFTMQELMDTPLEKQMPPASMNQVQSMFKEQMALEAAGKADPKRSLTLEFEVYRKDGSSIWSEMRVSFIRDDSGRPVGILGVSRDVTERRKTEETLRLLEKAVNTTRTGITFRDTYNIIRYTNHADAAMHGYRPEELIGREVSILADKRNRKSLDKEAMRTLNTWARESINVRKDGSSFPVSLVSDVVKDDMGEPVGIITVCEDITDRKRTEEELRKLSSAVSQSPVSVVITDTEGNIEYVNPYFTELTGYSYEEALGKNPSILRAGDLSDEYYSEMWKTLDAGQVWRGEFCNRKKNGGIFWENAIISPIKNNEGEVTHFVGVKEDITEQKKAQEALRNSEARMRAILNGAVDGIITVSDNGIIESLNPKALELLGYDEQELIGKSASIILPKAYRKKSFNIFKKYVDGKGAVASRALNFTALRKNGTTFPILLSVGEALLTEKTRLYTVIFSDVSDMKKTQDELKSAKRASESANMAKSEFLARMSHEIRTPMNAIIGMSTLAQMTGLDPQQAEYIGNISDASHSLLGIINDILDFSKIEAGMIELEYVEFRLEDVLRNTRNIISASTQNKDIELVFSISNEIPETLVGDPLRLEQVLTNLGTNSAKFTEKGDVVLDIELVSMEKGNVSLKFSVIDSGIGMTDNQVKGLFRAFAQADGSTTRKYGGSGLGLSISKRLVELMGGEINVSSAPGEGTRFSFSAPFGYKDEQQQRLDELKGVRALILDDDWYAAENLYSTLREKGLDAVTVSTIAEADEEYMRASANGRPFGILFVDSSIGGTDGPGALRMIRNMTRSLGTKGIVMTRQNNAKGLSFAYREVWEGYISKPMLISELVSTIRNVFGLDNQTGNAQPEALFMKEVLVENLRGRRILLAEDNMINQLLAVKLLERAGMTVDAVKDGKEAVQAAETVDYDLVLMDIEMPVMDGLEATARIRSNPRLKDLPIIAMTAHAMEEHRQRSLDAGMDGHISKPIETGVFYNTLLRWIEPKDNALQVIGSAGPDNGQKLQSDLPGELPGVDIQQGIKNFDGDHEFYMELLVEFRDRYNNVAGNIETCIREGNTKKAEIDIHALKGAAGALGAVELQRASDELEVALAKGAEDTFEVLLRGVREALAIVIKGLNGISAQSAELPYVNSAMHKKALLSLKPSLKSNRPKRCLSDMKHIMALNWPEDIKPALNELETLVSHYQYLPARKKLDALLARIGEEHDE